MSVQNFDVAVDPGGTCGWAQYGPEGLMAHGQGSAWQTACDINLACRLGVINQLHIEATFSHASSARAAGAPIAAEAAGEVIGALRWAGHVHHEPKRPIATVWRVDIGIELYEPDPSGALTKKGTPKKKRRKRAAFERDARRIAAQIAGLPKFKTAETHVAEAICIGWVAWRKRSGRDPTWRLA